MRPKPRARASVVPGFKNDCIVTIGDRIDPYFLRGMAAMNALGQRHGMPVAAARPGVVAQPLAFTDANGFVLVRAPINQIGLYTAGIDVHAPDGVTANTSSAVLVSAAHGTCPGG